MYQTGRKNTHYHECRQSVLGLERDSETKKERGKEMMVKLLLSHPILDSLQQELTFYIQQNVSRSGSAESSVNSRKLGKLCRLLHWHL